MFFPRIPRNFREYKFLYIYKYKNHEFGKNSRHNGCNRHGVFFSPPSSDAAHVPSWRSIACLPPACACNRPSRRRRGQDGRRSIPTYHLNTCFFSNFLFPQTSFYLPTFISHPEYLQNFSTKIGILKDNGIKQKHVHALLGFQRSSGLRRRRPRPPRLPGKPLHKLRDGRSRR